jgi:hypothetical protein
VHSGTGSPERPAAGLKARRVSLPRIWLGFRLRHPAMWSDHCEGPSVLVYKWSQNSMGDGPEAQRLLSLPETPYVSGHTETLVI